MNQYSIHRIIPFATFMAFIAVEELIGYWGTKGAIGFLDTFHLYIYPVKTTLIGFLLIKMRHKFDEIRLSDIADIKRLMTSIGVGIVVFIFWVNMPWTLAVSGNAPGYNPTTIGVDSQRYILICFRLLGAAILVPILEEIFWRSFVVRYIVDPDIEKVAIGQFTWPSFLITTLLFGLEHHLFFAGIMAGAAYNLLLYRTRSIAHCIVAHSITNFLLGCHVLITRQWQFW